MPHDAESFDLPHPVTQAWSSLHMGGGAMSSKAKACPKSCTHTREAVDGYLWPEGMSLPRNLWGLIPGMESVAKGALQVRPRFPHR